MFSAYQRRVNPGLIVAYLLAVLLVIGIGILAAVRLKQIGTTVDDLTNHLAVDRALADNIVSQVLLVQFYANRYVRTQLQTDLDHFNEAFAGLEKLLHQADREITDPERAEMLELIEPAVEKYGDTFKQIAELVRERQRIRSETLDAQELVIENNLTALRMHVVSLNGPDVFLSFSYN